MPVEAVVLTQETWASSKKLVLSGTRHKGNISTEVTLA